MTTAKVTIPTPQEAEDSAYKVLLEFCIDRVSMYGMCNVNACVFSDGAILRVLKDFQDLGWIATCIPKNDIHDPSAGGVVSIRPPGEPPITNMPEPMAMIEESEEGDDGFTEQSL